MEHRDRFGPDEDRTGCPDPVGTDERGHGDALASLGTLEDRRAQRIIQLTADGWSVKQIAGELSYSPKYIKNIRTRLFRRYGVSNACQLVATSYRSGLIR